MAPLLRDAHRAAARRRRRRGDDARHGRRRAAAVVLSSRDRAGSVAASRRRSRAASATTRRPRTRAFCRRRCRRRRRGPASASTRGGTWRALLARPTPRLRAGQLRSGVAVPAAGRSRPAPSTSFVEPIARARRGAAARLDLRPGSWRAAGHAGVGGAHVRRPRSGRHSHERPSADALLEKYDVPVPRYTSYPAVPHWQETPAPDDWFDALDARAGADSASLAVYVHLPFCETLCTFCGCNTVITRNHERSAPVRRHGARRARPLSRARAGASATARCRRCTSAAARRRSCRRTCSRRCSSGIAARLPLRADGFEGSVEVDPRVTTREHLDVLRAHGLSRISLGVQDFDAEVLRLVNRPQPLEITAALCAPARDVGLRIDQLRPDLRAARADAGDAWRGSPMPWSSCGPIGSRSTASRACRGSSRRSASSRTRTCRSAPRSAQLYEILRERLLAAGYLEIGLDHFALPHDALARRAPRRHAASQLHGLHRSPHHGAARSRRERHFRNADCYHQNEKVITVYERRVAEGEIPTLRGHMLSDDDRRRADRDPLADDHAAARR